ncbi:MAG: sugar phosphate isomerase/epimerase, partial [Hyphomicrobiales bacterium]|nr:sugar phosphate isomerase/epimerase [Hyphomicrobiales bacterium]
MRDLSKDHSLLSINTATLRKEQGREASLAKIVDVCARRGVRAISPWRDQV